MTEKHDGEEDFEPEVGYGRPPVHSRWKKGQSGNPKGRPKRSKNLTTLIDQELERPIEIKEDGRRQRLTKREAIVRRLVNNALAGNTRSIEFLAKHLFNEDAPDPFAPNSHDEAELMKKLESILKAQGKNGQD